MSRLEQNGAKNYTDGQGIVESRVEDYLLMEGREYRKGFDWIELVGLLENVHEHSSRVFDTTDVVHVFRFFVIARDIHEIIVGE